jgi:NAD(P)-dependent dehydrogenase (short-subunit alcohol dehydrogenase family)
MALDIDNYAEQQAPVALVTGAGRGIGRAIAVRLAGEGYRIGLVARSAAELAETAELVTAAGSVALSLPGDVTEPADVDRVCGLVEEQWGPIDLLVNNAAYFGDIGSFLATDPARWWRVLETNLRGPALLDHRVLPGMVTRGRGRVITMSSLAAGQDDPVAPSSAYSVSKTAALRLDAILAGELADTGVRVFSLSPGLVRTRMSELRPDIDDIAPQSFVAPEVAAGQVAALASGRYDLLHGRFLHARDDLDALLAALPVQPAARVLALRPIAPVDAVLS